MFGSLEVFLGNVSPSSKVGDVLKVFFIRSKSKTDVDYKRFTLVIGVISVVDVTKMSRISFDPNLKEWPPRCFDRSTARICVMGDISVGKTTLILRWLRGVFEVIESGEYSEDLYHKTLMMQELLKKFNKEEDSFDDDGDYLKKFSALDVQILDCNYVDMAYDSVDLMTAQIKQCDAFILCFAPTSRESFENLNGLFHRIEENAQDPVITICSTKSDLYLDSEIKLDEVADRLEALGYSMEDDYEEVSAKTGTNVDLLFCTVLQKVAKCKKDARLLYKQAAIEDGEARDTTPSPVQSYSSDSASLHCAKKRTPTKLTSPVLAKEFPREDKAKCCIIS